MADRCRTRDANEGLLGSGAAGRRTPTTGASTRNPILQAGTDRCSRPLRHCQP